MITDEQLKYWEEYKQAGELVKEIRGLRALLALSVEQTATCREALEAVEWVLDDMDGDHYCQWCGGCREHGGHRSDCKRQAALAKLESKEDK